MNLLGALPARFRRLRVLVVGCGDVGERVVRGLGSRVQWLATTSSPERVPELRRLGVRPVAANLDHPQQLRRLSGVATHVIHLAPPSATRADGARTDPRTAALQRVFRRGTPPRQWVYVSTTGVYGDCQGAWVDETRAVAPHNERAWRRVDAEYSVKNWGGAYTVLRAPGIYALNREGGTPAARLQRGTPVLQPSDDVYTNHIHADDLARACIVALVGRGRRRVIQVTDDSDMTMGDYFDMAARVLGLPPPPRVTREEARAELSPMQWSFMTESRRLSNQRMKQELGLRLRYPTAEQGLRTPTNLL